MNPPPPDIEAPALPAVIATAITTVAVLRNLLFAAEPVHDRARPY